MSDTDGDGVELAVVVPHTGNVSMRWAVTLATLDAPPHHIVTKSNAALDLSRELAVEDALEGGAEWLLLLDSDVIPPPDVFFQLQRTGRRVVSALYLVDHDVPQPAAWVLDDDSPSSVRVDAKGNVIVDDDGDPRRIGRDETGLVTVDAIGLGCVLVHRSIFEKLEQPWFRWTKGYEDHPWDLRDESGEPGVSEDFFFCHRLAEAGIDIHLDTSVQCAHEKGCLLTGDGVVMESQLDGET